VRNILLLDVTPLSLGLETKGGVMTVLIPRNTTIPTRKRETFTTANDNQSQVDIHVLQGERPMADENKSLGRFVLDGIPPAPRGIPQIEVTFDIDANGILNVSARDVATGKEQRIVIQPSSGLTEAEIERMVREAEQHAADDARRREEAELFNRADNTAHAADRFLSDSSDRLPSGPKLELESEIQKLRQALDRRDVAAVRTALSALEQKLQAAQEAAAAPVGAAVGATPGPTQAQSAADDAVEGEFREI
jgi:molecular chaperone DnaK